MGRLFQPRKAFRRTGPTASASIVVAEKSAVPDAREDLRGDAGRRVARLSDGRIISHAFAAYLPKAFDDANFAFYGTVLQRHRRSSSTAQTRAVHLLDGMHGRSARQALCRASISRRRPRRRPIELVDNLLKAYDADIRTLHLDDAGDARRRRSTSCTHFTPHDRLSRQLARLFRRS